MLIDQTKVDIQMSPQEACIQNTFFSIRFNLKTGGYSGVDRSTGTCLFRDAWFRLGEGGWKEQDLTCEAEVLEDARDTFGKGKTLRVWYRTQARYEPDRFLNITVYAKQPFFVIGWGVHNKQSYTVRVRSAEVLVNAELFAGQDPIEPRVLRGGAGAEQNYVEDTWRLDAVNSGMLTYRDRLDQNRRQTIVAGGLKYSEFLRKVEFHNRPKGGRRPPGMEIRDPRPQSFMSLSIQVPQGKRIAPGRTWCSTDTFLVNICTANPFESLESFGAAMAQANKAAPNPYDFITLCGWMTSDDVLGDNVPINNSPALVDQIKIAKETGLTRYTDIAVRLEPDYYCYNDQGDTQQGWFDDDHWARYGALQKPYETFRKFCAGIAAYGGKVFTYVQGSMPSNDFALEHPDWILNDDISLLHEHRRHARTKVRYDYTEPDFQAHMRAMWTRLGRDGVIGLKFDYPETAWAKHGGFEDDSYTTVSAYRAMYQLCRAGLGPDGFIHERIMGSKEADVPCTDVCVGIVDLQRVWPDSSHFEPEMASRMGLRWYKQNVAIRYYPDGKSFFPRGVPATQSHRRTFLTLVGLLSGRLEIGTGFGRLTDEIRYDMTRLYPVLPNGKAFRPVDCFLSKQHPEVYVYAVDETWAQVILVNNQENGRGIPPSKLLKAPVSGDQPETGSLGLPVDRNYYVFDFWAQKPLGMIRGDGYLEASLKNGEARVYAVRAVENHPRIIGTNRHVMCGMMEISNTLWDNETTTLSFDAAVVAGETMIITVALPEEPRFTVDSVACDDLTVAAERKGNVVKIFADTLSSGTGGNGAAENTRARIVLTFC